MGTLSYTQSEEAGAHMFETYAHLKAFWSLIEPALPLMVRATTDPPQDDGQALQMSLRPIDEFFLFMRYLSLYVEQEELAESFNIHVSAVYPIIITWAHFLYEVLGVIGIWQDEECIQQNMPEVFADYTDTHIILESFEIYCQTPDTLVLKDEMSYSTVKGLVGMAPHGPVTFISPLYESFISDRGLLRLSGLQALLKPSMAIMVNRSNFMETVVSCRVYSSAFLGKRKKSSLTQLSAVVHQKSVRVHVWRVINRVKNNKLFNTVIPAALTSSINQLFSVTCLLTNYQSGPLKSDK